MKKTTFMDENFLLETETARELYHACAEKLPILDYHCHLDPREIAEDKRYENLARVWLAGDHYKWRQMRSNGAEEAYITGDAPDFEKFCQWAQTLEKAVGNPLYHWSHLELRRYFGYEGTLGADTAQEVWELCRKRLLEEDMSVRGILRASHVTLVCTTDDPGDDLRWHRQIASEEHMEIQVLPTFRADRACSIEQAGFAEYMQELGRAASVEIKDFGSWKKALSERMDYFEESGCRVSDHGLLYLPWKQASESEIEKIFADRLSGREISREQELKFQTAAMLWLGEEYQKRGWVMQLHFGVTRNNNARMFQLLGADTGFDGIYNQAPLTELSAYLDALCQKNALPKTILYSLNPADNAPLGALLGCFQEAGTSGKIQQGSAWWFNDHKAGMEEQLTSLANLGLLGNFIGMLTDSRSFLSYTRHEYFRRILCNLIGGWVENGEYPYHREKLFSLIKNICYNNAVEYFGFNLEKV
ncbi:MAG: glucuronate isomerase [Lachnospiraceae bacterium]|nr:glucuronate isomerase [Lachnospiraceae bacterium]